VERDEPELAGVGRRAGDEHALRLEQAAELLVARTGSEGRPIPLVRAQLDETVDGDESPIGLHDERVDVDAGHVRSLVGQAAEPDQDRHELRGVDGRITAEVAQQLLGSQVGDHLACRDDVERRRAEHHVGHRLGEHTSHAEHHRCTELAVAHHAGDQLTTAPDHRGDQDRDRTVVGTGSIEQFVRGGPDGLRVGEPEPDETPFGLVGDGVAVQLGNCGKAEVRCRVRRLGGGGRHTFAGDRHAELGQQCLGVLLGERARCGGDL